MATWTVEYEGDSFEKFMVSLPKYEQAVLIAAVRHVLSVHGKDICAGEWGKPLGDGLYEFRVKKSLKAILSSVGLESVEPGDDRMVLLRVFCTFHGSKIVLLFHGYDKKKDPSSKRQQREINKAKSALRAWKKAQS